jgi:hypothetical protein
VLVEERAPQELPRVDEVRPKLLRLALEERGDVGVARGLARLRSLYEVRVDGDVAPL